MLKDGRPPKISHHISLWVIVLVGLCTGCGTVLTRTGLRGLAGHPYPRFYPATYGDVRMIYDPKVEGYNSTVQRNRRRVMLLFDVPISLTTDTLYLPFDTFPALRPERHAKEPKKAPSPPATTSPHSAKP